MIDNFTIGCTVICFLVLVWLCFEVYWNLQMETYIQEQEEIIRKLKEQIEEE